MLDQFCKMSEDSNYLSAMKQFDIITVGSITQDVFLRSPAFKVRHDRSMVTGKSQSLPLGVKIDVEDMTVCSGGGASNAAATFARQNFRVAYVGRVGKDDAGITVLRELRGHGVVTDYVRRDPSRPTGYSVILSTPFHGRTILSHRGASSALSKRDIPSDVKAGWWYVTALGGNVGLLRHIVRTARSRGGMVMVNPGWDELRQYKPVIDLLRKSAIVMMNKEEGNLLLGKRSLSLHAVARLLARMLPSQILLLTDGEGGSFVQAGSEWYSAGAHQHLRAVERTGAGDAFGSGFLSGLLRSQGDIPTALQWGTANAESVIQVIGAKNGLLYGPPKRAVLLRVRRGTT